MPDSGAASEHDKSLREKVLANILWQNIAAATYHRKESSGSQTVVTVGRALT